VRRVVWTDESVANLESIADYIDVFSPPAARRLALRLKDAGDSLLEHPSRGRIVRGSIREPTIIFPYVIRDRVEGETVRILRVRHGARWPT